MLAGEVPGALAPQSGCAFHTRCPYATKACDEAVRALTPFGDRRSVACIHAAEIASA